MTRTLLFASTLAILPRAGCGGPRSRVVDADEPAIVDARKVGDDEFIKATREFLKKVSERTNRGWSDQSPDTAARRPLSRCSSSRVTVSAGIGMRDA